MLTGDTGGLPFAGFNFRKMNFMKNPLINSKHIKEYLLYGLICAVVYTFFVVLFLLDNKYENFYLLYIGNFTWMGVMGIYHYQLINRQYEGKRSVSMLIAGGLMLLCGVAMALIMLVVAIVVFHPGVFSSVPADAIVQDAPDTIQVHKPIGLVFMIAMNTVLVNLGAGSLVSVLFAYAGKRNQVKDQPTPTNNRIHPVSKTAH